MITFIDTHAHIDGEEFDADRDEVITRAKAAGAIMIFVPAISMKTMASVIDTATKYSGFVLPMIGLHPEEVDNDYQTQLDAMRKILDDSRKATSSGCRFIGIGEVGLDFYWTRENETQQLEAFEKQVEWAIETRLPLMIHCRKAQNEMVKILRHYERDLPGGVFHCFTGNEKEAAELLQFDGFALGIGGVVTFKKSNLPAVVASLPLERIVLETDSPYMSPAPHRGQRNESSMIVHIIDKIAEARAVSAETIAQQTTDNALRIFHLTR